MATIKIIDWEQLDTIAVDSDNAESRAGSDGTIINPKSTSVIKVVLSVDSELHCVQINAPYERQKVIDALNAQLSSRTVKTDVGVEFEATLT